MQLSARVAAGLTGLVLAHLAVVPPAFAQGSADGGRRVALAQCSRCHAVERDGDSPNPRSPRFRDLGQRYPFDGLRQALLDGLIVGHPALMPRSALSGTEVDDLIVYMKDLQRPARSARRGGVLPVD